MSDIDIMSILDDYPATLDVHNAALETQKDMRVESSRILVETERNEFAYWNQ